jgi:5-methylcytosine-specific restriction endonuclease McrA
MTRHVRIYMDYFGYGEQDVILCEVCGQRAVDIHHIDGRGKGKDVISNLIALCRKCHNAAHGLEKTYLHKDVIHKIHEKVYKHD